MKRKITGVIVCMLLISAAVLSAAGTMNIDQTEDFLSLFSYNSSDGMCGITWDATLNFIETGDNIDSAIFGEAPDANDGPPVDAYDMMMPPPPPMPPYIRAWFDDGLPEPYNMLWEDYRHYPDTYKIWNLSVQWVPDDYTSPTDITISWDIDEIDDSEYTDVVLYDVTGGTVVADMLVDTDYTFAAAAMVPKAFQIICSLNEPPGFSDENPSDGSVDVPVTLSELSVTIEDPEGDSFDWTIETSSNIGSSSGNGEGNGTKTCPVSGLNYGTTYTWYVNATDSGSETAREEVYTFTTEPVPNEPPYKPSEPDPENGSIDVSINTNLNWTGGDPDVEDNVTYDVYFGTITIPPQVSSNQSDTTYDPGTLDYETQYYWKIVAWDNHDASTTGPIWDFTTKMEPKPDLDCDGEMSWVDVKPGSTVTGSFTVENIGDPGSELDWEVIDWPDWGSGNSWTFVPSSGDDLASGDSVTVQVTVVAPDEKNQQFSGQIKIENSENSSDTCTIDVSLATPVNYNSVFLQFLERLINQFPLLERILSSRPFLDRILSLK